MSARPSHLPDFLRPPINEVVLGVQFAPSPSYQQMHAFEVWELFKADYPTTQEHPPIVPAFETFGRPQVGKFNIEFETGVMPTRYWFISPGGNELIQFQSDRLLHNWRQVSGEANVPYPRFDVLLGRFESEIAAISAYFAQQRSHKLVINQCELSYINNIPFDVVGANLGRWLSFLDFPMSDPDDLAAKFRYTVRSADGKPLARLTCELSTGVSADESKRIIIFNLTFRGAPTESTPKGALDLLRRGRSEIVTKFTELTSDLAHKDWERTQ
ncbi:MAG: TIGR04255 family protein [Pirellulaceae bacterium]